MMEDVRNMMARASTKDLARTAEMVTHGHPDKYCDQVADRILDEALRQDRSSRVAIECLAKNHLLIVSGEVTTRASLDFATIARRVYQDDIGYGTADHLTVVPCVCKQSGDIAVGVDRNGAGDQGVMIGYATDETPEALPLEYVLARRLALGLKALRQQFPWFGPDGKTQVTIEGGRVTSVVVAAQHDASVTVEEVRSVVREKLINPVLGEGIPRVVINGTGIFSVGGPLADAGVVGRKIVADAYGPRVPVGGGAYSGKDPTKVDRSAAYMARQIAKTIVAHQISGARQCRVDLAYAIGQSQPEMISAVTDSGCDVSSWVRDHFKDLSPGAIIERLGLLAPEGWSYMQTAAYGHYGRDMFPWETVVRCA